ncbi:MAG: hypothetical protein C75L2_00380090 [Leptospirillum sp. Group II 'C75']|jgi:hypothetical protein|uniref:Uncharacterized protein n=3 Tax=Leptospirillum ferriphilum TaxID=178606 RepID=A0A059Y034_9BACT|nr:MULTISPECIES: hypothetical protein [Leptospirillum]EAY56802.1 MAG: protein of unknown function [Leptospirillum rubarum]EIJ76725.1 MAG: hypothetical protein C75L2_00380090 [Leptospirillum sp. Group II 'C75']AFS54089.1 hypothetical protein LFML04_1889 [Leptospirillum ferriphilum ML-04]AIA30896.1 hypothetical protein Y981_09605 [Leptospirillum ferriphilum YSK]AKS23994.1 hypothetical protein ABH19_09995 [Leptospirillum sp. Group II 'CF-1']
MTDKNALDAGKDESQSSWSAALHTMANQVKLMGVLLVILMVFFTFWGKAHLKSRAFQKKLVTSQHLLRIGLYPSYNDAMTHLTERVSGAIKVYRYSPDIRVWYGHLSLFGVAFPDEKGIIRHTPAGYELLEED